MAADRSEVQVYNTDTWKLGTRGQRGSFYHNMPYIRDMRMYADGSLGPRPRWHFWAEGNTNSGPPLAGYLDTQEPATAVVHKMQRQDTHSAAPFETWLVIEQDSGVATRARTIVIVGGIVGVTSVTLTTAQANTYGPAVWVSPIGSSEAVIDNFSVRLSGSSDAVVDIEAVVDTVFSGADTFVFRGSCVHQGRAFVWGAMVDGSDVVQVANRLYFSDTYSYAAFSSASQFLDVDGTVAGAASIGSSLLIWTDAGDWFILQGRGNPRTDGVLNTLGKGRIPERNVQPARLDNVIVFRSSDQTSVVVVGEDGEIDDRSLSHLALNTTPREYFGTTNTPNPKASSLSNSVLLPKLAADGGCHHNANSVWTDEEWTFDLRDGLTVFVDDQKAEEGLRLIDSTDTDDAYLYVREILIGEPEEETAFTYLEDPTGVIGLPRIESAGRSVSLVQVVVKGRYWAGADHRSTNMLCIARDGLGGAASCTAIGDPTETPTGVPDGLGEDYRFTFKPQVPMSMSAHLDIELTTIIGFTVEEVLVEYMIHSPSLLA